MASPASPSSSAQLSAELSRLHTTLRMRDSRITELESALESLVLNENDDVESAKDRQIHQLARKNRALRMKLNAARSKIAQANEAAAAASVASKPSRLRHYASKSATGSSSGRPNTSASDVSTASAASSDEVRSLRRKVQTLTKKLTEHRLAAETFRAKNARLVRLLRSEIGDDRVASEVLRTLETDGSDGSDGTQVTTWRGRAETIVLLRDKLKSLRSVVVDLRRRVVESEQRAQRLREERDDSEDDGDPSRAPRNTTSTASTSLSETKLNAHLEQLDASRTEQIKRLNSELDASQRNFTRARQRVKALRSRVQILERDNTASKTKLERLLQKTLNDTKLITLLKERLSSSGSGNSNSNATNRRRGGSGGGQGGRRRRVRERRGGVLSSSETSSDNDERSTLRMMQMQQIEQLKRDKSNLEEEVRQTHSENQHLQKRLKVANERVLKYASTTMQESLTTTAVTTTRSARSRNKKNLSIDHPNEEEEDLETVKVRQVIAEIRAEKMQGIGRIREEQIQDLQAQLEQTSAKLAQSQQESAVLKKKLDALSNRFRAGHAENSPTAISTSSSITLPSIALDPIEQLLEGEDDDLEGRLAYFQSETEVLKATLESVRRAKKREVEAYREMLAEQKARVDSLVNQSEREHVRGGDELMNDDQNVDSSSALEQSLKVENSRLRDQVTELKARANVLEMRLQEFSDTPSEETRDEVVARRTRPPRKIVRPMISNDELPPHAAFALAELERRNGGGGGGGHSPPDEIIVVRDDDGAPAAAAQSSVPPPIVLQVAEPDDDDEYDYDDRDPNAPAWLNSLDDDGGESDDEYQDDYGM